MTTLDPSTLREVRKFLPSFRAKLEGAATETAEEIISSLSAYEVVDRSSLVESCEENIRQAIEWLRAGTSPSPGEMDSVAGVAKKRFEANLSIDKMILGYRISIQSIHAAFIDIGQSKLSPEALAKGSKILWEVGDAFLARAVVTFDILRASQLESEAGKRSLAMGSLLAGRATDADLATLRLRRNASYAVLRAAGSDPTGQLRSQIEQSGSYKGYGVAVVAMVGEIVAVVSQVPRIGTELSVGLGDFMPLNHLSVSDLQARKVLDACEKVGRAGLQTLGSMNWRVAIPLDEQLNEHFAKSFVVPLAAESQNLLESVVAWIDSGFNYSRAGEKLHVHENTVRYRIDKFCALTGMQKDCFDDWVGVKWAASTLGL